MRGCPGYDSQRGTPDTTRSPLRSLVTTHVTGEWTRPCRIRLFAFPTRCLSLHYVLVLPILQPTSSRRRLVPGLLFLVVFAPSSSLCGVRLCPVAICNEQPHFARHRGKRKRHSTGRPKLDEIERKNSKGNGRGKKTSTHACRRCVRTITNNQADLA